MINIIKTINEVKNLNINNPLRLIIEEDINELDIRIESDRELSRGFCVTISNRFYLSPADRYLTIDKAIEQLERSYPELIKN